ncbi:unnamed protein product [Rotaria magnacalcarata]|uniref:Uncharacterized protein n=1 Tax=Rotaria magnacalcarata TaxID=392030 RepID=A0A816MV19_9BILA|nr:unnamed protein product [Rotaria magnacalcarata]CAF5220628.1 unnamed protein product [Rotaria magnacalcarata]
MLKDVRSMEQINQSATSCRDNLKDQQEIVCIRFILIGF